MYTEDMDEMQIIDETDDFVEDDCGRRPYDFDDMFDTRDEAEGR